MYTVQTADSHKANDITGFAAVCLLKKINPYEPTWNLKQFNLKL